MLESHNKEIILVTDFGKRTRHPPGNDPTSR